MSLHKSHYAEDAAQPMSIYSSHDIQQEQHLLEVPIASRSSKKVSRSTKYPAAGRSLLANSQGDRIASSSVSATKTSANKLSRHSINKGNTGEEAYVLPRTTSSPYIARLDSLASLTPSPPPPVTASSSRSRLPVPHGSSGGNDAGSDSSRNVLRRKAPSVQQYVSSLPRPETHSNRRIATKDDAMAKRSSKSLPGDLRQPSPDAVQRLGPQPFQPTILPKRHSGELPPTLIPELKALAGSTALNRAASTTPHASSIGSPSTQYSSSTGMWGDSRDTTPTSISSSSPGIIQPSIVKTPHRLRKTVPSPSTTSGKSRFMLKTPPATEKTFGPSPEEYASKKDSKKHFLLQQYPKSPVQSVLAQPAEHVSSQNSEERGSEDVGRATGIVELLDESIPYAVTSAQGLGSKALPSRPSRKGTADLDTRLSPIVQSNLSRQSLGAYRRRDSIDMDNVGNSIRGKPLGQGIKPESYKEAASAVQPLHRQVSQEQGDLASKPSKLPVVVRTTIPTKHTFSNKASSNQKGHEPGRSTMDKLSSRLGMFGRRAKVDRDGTSFQESRDVRKGPAAGTGHEGYGRYARRGRKSSVGSGINSRDQSTSTASRPSLGRKNSRGSAGGSDVDEFIAQRLQPVVIPGGGRHEARPDSNAPTIWPPFDGTPFGSGLSFDSAVQLTDEPLGSVATDSRSMSVGSVATDAPSSIAMDAWPRTFSMSTSSQSYPAHAPPSLDGYSTSQSSLVQDDAPKASLGRSIERPNLRDLQKASKTGRMFKWNLFRRKDSAEKLARGVEKIDPESMGMSVAIAATSADKPIPYYALMDSENENEGGDNLQDLFQQIHESPSTDAERSSQPQGLGLRQQYGQSVLLPSMPTLEQENPHNARLSSLRGEAECRPQPVELPISNSSQFTDNKRLRLPQVGRIPRVISRRDRQHKPAATSFSRPFQHDNFVGIQKGSDSDTTPIAETKRPILGIQTDVLPSRPFHSPESGQAASAPVGPPITRPLGDFVSRPEFLLIPGKVESGALASGSSDTIFSMSNLSESAEHRNHTEEDEIWDEYDDLLDHVLSPTSSDLAQAPLGPSSSQPFGHSSHHVGASVRPESYLRLERLHKAGSTAYPAEPHSVYMPQLSPFGGKDGGYRLRRSRIVAALRSQSSTTPSTPLATNDHSSSYLHHGISSNVYERQLEGNDSIHPELLSPLSDPPHPPISSMSGVSQHHSKALLDIAEREHEGPVGQSDLRFAALMTSRWLSFGRVLFSPAHNLVKASAGHQILVIDGLGNDDWSFYCAVTYPDSVVYDLKETDVSTRGSQSELPRDPWQAPPNYKRAELPNLAERFPFPQSYFAAVVFRFPAAMSDSVLKLAFSECKRVLIPGGHLELSLVDLDIVNMGTVTRHAIRNLKARMLGADPNVSLKPVSDNIQNMLGQGGFENLNRCMVGVSVAGKVATSSGSRSSRSSRESYSQKGKDADQSSSTVDRRNHRNNGSDRSRHGGGNFSLTELVSDHSATSDEKITKMVAKVGRWWYTRSYEWAVLPGGDLKKSIWCDKRMLHECKARGSSFKLLIAYAQKPIEARRRTLSEPISTTAAVAGTRMMNRLDRGHRPSKTQ
ncbi:hypothetical protein EPUS_04655 [Endocarpon pusillum Z07020]|uniref:Methyltransferase type 11 domain-containing protein n=1 Tax=Endocarpon pusillum (strain Z07020 / HMAS-L-300199) TaxID=1263415 RepID=U1FUR7_ENDPU|nr:uncharacterized protein EPUS_04655 [Endocarpon pusillum Z07020]ERF68557.1 hypothetical protein EPUS_04655 [Endocarpon pusillum Z07020]